MPKRSFPIVALVSLVLLGVTGAGAAAAELPRPVVQISPDTRLKWGVAARSVSPLLESKGTRLTEAPLAHLFDEERDRSTVVITDTPWRRGGIMTMGMRLEF